MLFRSVGDSPINVFPSDDDIRTEKMTDCLRMHGEGIFVGKCNFCMPEHGTYTVYELGELGSLKVSRLVHELYTDMVQCRAVNSGNEVLQILASTKELKLGEGRKDSLDSGYGRSACLIGD